jgi:hypothetical protein
VLFDAHASIRFALDCRAALQECCPQQCRFDYNAVDGPHLQVPPPLALGTVQLEDGAAVKGFICEGHVAEVQSRI